MVREETSIAEKISKLPDENIVLNKNFNGREPDIWFKYYDCTIDVDEGNHENYNSDNEKEREDMFKKYNIKIAWRNPNDPNFDLFKFVGKINLHISKLHGKKQWIKWLIKLPKTSKKSSNKIKRIKTIFKKHFTKLQKMKYTKSELNWWKLGKVLEQRIILFVKILPTILGHKK